KQATLEHLLENEKHARTLGRRHDRGGHDVGRESGPRSVFQFGDVPAEVRPDPPFLPRTDAEPGSLYSRPDSESLETKKDAAQIFGAYRLDRHISIGNGG